MKFLFLDFLKLKEHYLFTLAQSTVIRIFSYSLINYSVDIEVSPHLIVIDVRV